MELFLNIVQTTVVVAAAVASYFRFFKGRMLSPRLSVQVTGSALPASKNVNHHVVRFELENTGSVPVWEPTPHIWVDEHASKAKEVREYGAELWEPKQRSGRAVIDTGETMEFALHHEVHKDAWAATYTLRVTCASRKVWTRSITLSNRLDEDEHSG